MTMGDITLSRRVPEQDNRRALCNQLSVELFVERDTRIALLEQKVAEHDKMLAEGNDRFDRIERELKETNGLLRELVGMFKASRRNSEDAC